MFGNGDLIEIDAAPYRALARVRGIDGPKLHVAFEHGAYLPWRDDPVQIRRCSPATPASDSRPDDLEPSFDGRILHTSTATALIEVLGQTPTKKLPAYVPPTGT